MEIRKKGGDIRGGIPNRKRKAMEDIMGDTIKFLGIVKNNF